MPDAPGSVLPTPSEGGAPAAPGAVLAAAEGGGAPAAPSPVLPAAGGGGAPAAPGSVLAAAGAEALVAATLITTFGSPNSNLKLTANAAGVGGNEITFEAVTSGPNLTLAITVTDIAIHVRMASNGFAVPTTTANQLKAALEASAPAMALVSVALAPGNSGAGVCTTMEETPLEGGTGGVVPPQPVLP
ncbi:MAG: hypothetical protein EOP87_00925 [Verrucomicrobiaceae bacterium]|nr:MAG: hypothetical protein EOP87_00925 [Verrucomicrobiaceae bacterium]